MSMKSLLKLLSSLSFIFLISAAVKEETGFIYEGFRETNLKLEESAHVLGNGLLELTNTSKRMIGRAFYPSPIRLRDSSFSVTFVFAIKPSFPKYGGHGMVFILSSSWNFSYGIATQYFGIYNTTANGNSSSRFLAVEIDTVKSPDLEDINDNHIGIDLNNLMSIVSAPAGYYSDPNERNVTDLNLQSGDSIQIWIEYDDKNKKINVTLAPFLHPKPEKPLLTASMNLSFLHSETVYVGFSASTGTISSSHYILGWSFQINGPARPLNPSNLPKIPRAEKESSKNKLYILILVACLSVLGLVIGLGIIYCIVRKKRYEELFEEWEKGYGPHRFKYKDLYRATKGFGTKNFLGRGAFGEVYEGLLPNSKTKIAVKRASHNPGSSHVLQEFIAEVVSIGRMRHRNIVPLLGYCRRKRELLLVYELMENGSLDRFIFNSNSFLDWPKRFKIIRGVAAGLVYLHEEWEHVVLHRDVKPSNVLLDSELNGRLGDFGISRLYDHGVIPVTSKVAGTLGYLAPEYSRTGKVTRFIDVYAYGVLLLEIVCSRHTIEPQGRTLLEVVLVDWVEDLWKKGNIRDAMDVQLVDESNIKEIELVLKVGILCTNPRAEKRPTIRQVIQYLDGDAILPEVTVENTEPYTDEIGLDSPTSHTSSQIFQNVESIF